MVIYPSMKNRWTAQQTAPLLEEHLRVALPAEDVAGVALQHFLLREAEADRARQVRQRVEQKDEGKGDKDGKGRKIYCGPAALRLHESALT